MDLSDCLVVLPLGLKNFLGLLLNPLSFCSSEKVIPWTSYLKANFGRSTSFCFQALSRGLRPAVLGPVPRLREAGDHVHCCSLRSVSTVSAASTVFLFHPGFQQSVCFPSYLKVCQNSLDLWIDRFYCIWEIFSKSLFIVPSPSSRLLGV